MAMVLLVTTALAWSIGQQALEQRGAMHVDLLSNTRLRYAGMFLVSMLLNFYGPSLLIFRIHIMPGGQALLLGFSALFAGSYALTQRGSRSTETQRELPDAHPKCNVASPRFATTMVFAMFQGALLLWLDLAIGLIGLGERREPPVVGLVLLMLWGTAVWGFWLGVGAGLRHIRPFRALVAAILCFTISMLLSAGLWFGSIWLSVRISAGAAANSTPIWRLVHLTLVLLMSRSTTRMLYRK
ncbi:hypothetical protein [Variovorax paradoxus]|uniref:hypothetical protein n=1 Tax=Variovorax paradoxus TaxID=34073 RepID=UPI003D65B91C